MIKQSKVCCNALETAFEITKLIKFSPKRNVIFDRIRSEEDPSSVGICTFCLKRWTVRGDSSESILIIINTSTSDLQPSIAIANQLPGQ